MPVKTARRDGRIRVVEAATGRVAKNRAGTAIDGGGYPPSKKSTAERQKRAVNASLSRRRR